MSETIYGFIVRNNYLCKIEILDIDEHNEQSKTMYNQQNGTYQTSRYKIIEIYDIYGNLINEDENIEKVLVPIDCVFEDQGIVLYHINMNVALDNLRCNIFFDETYIYIDDKNNMGYIRDDFPMYQDDYITYITYLCEKKDNIDINFSDIQRKWGSLGDLLFEFYHVNGIKQGPYKIYRDDDVIEKTLYFIDDVCIKVE